MEIYRIISLLNQTFQSDAWHGPSVREGLAGISGEQSLRRLPNTHSIIEIVAHMTEWRKYVLKKLDGDSDYMVSAAMNFPQCRDWTQTVTQLEESQAQLITSLEKFPEEKLDQLVAGVTTGRTYYMLLQGIIHHDLYHTGQILLIRKATE